MTVPASFDEAKRQADALWTAAGTAGARLDAFPKGPDGLTPDAVKATPEWRSAKADCDASLARLRAFNAVFTKRFKRELTAERRAKLARTT